MTNPTSIFVSPALCSKLAERGLTRDTWAVWREYFNTAKEPSSTYLVAPGLDMQGVYATLDLPEGVHTMYADTPAYTLIDMLVLIPGFHLRQVDATTNEVTGYNKLNPLMVVGDASLPDTAALMVLQLIERCLCSLATLNHILLRSPLNTDQQ